MNDKKSTHEVSVDLSDEKVQKGMDRRSFLGKTTKMAGVAIGASLVGSIPGFSVEAASRSSVMKPTEKKLDLVFPVISDVHIYSDNDRNLNKFTTTLQQLNKIAPNQDAFAVVGDLTEHGYAEQFDRFMTAFNGNKQRNAVPLMAIGNHDYWNGLSVADAQKRFLTKTGMESIYFHKVIKGYHFIVLGTEDGLTEGTYSVNQIQWLGKQLKAAHEDDPKKPIFVFHHQPMTETVYGSEWGFTKNRDLMYDTLKPYPQVITFSGHTHYPLDDPRIIHQKDFTTIGTSTGAYVWLDKGRIQGEVPAGADILNQALVVEVYNNKVFIKPRDIHNDDWTGEPFEISLPANKQSFKYTEKRRNKKAPRFPKDAMISIVNEQTTALSLTVMLTQAKDDLLVHDYKILAKRADNGKVEKEVLAFSDFYKDPIPNPISYRIDGLKPNTLYEIEVFALDAYENQSVRSLKTLGKTHEGHEPTITLSKNRVNSLTESIDVTIEHVRNTNGTDWIGVYEINENPGSVASIWWQWTNVKDGKVQFTYDPSKNTYPDRYQSGHTYQFIYFYGGGYDAVATASFTIG